MLQKLFLKLTGDLLALFAQHWEFGSAAVVHCCMPMCKIRWRTILPIYVKKLISLKHCV